MGTENFDFDWLVVGSGFGGSVAALRLAEKGYAVAVLESGRRFRDEDFAATTWDLKRYFWMPVLGLRGILRLTLFKDILAGSGAGVGGGSLVYANTLYRAKPAFFQNPQWAELNDWSALLAPHYDTAERMLGVQTVPFDSAGQRLLQEMGAYFGVEKSWTRTPCAVFFGQAGVKVADPYFAGEGPERTGCTRCGSCMVGCRVGAKNTLLKNYLWFAEKNGATILPDREVAEIRPLDGGDGSDGSEGYAVTTRRPGAWLFGQQRTYRARGVVVAAGAIGSNQLLAQCKHSGALPDISARLGQLVRTNSESILAVTLPDDRLKPALDVAISSSIHPGQDTHIEFVTYGAGGDLMSSLFTLLTGPGNRLTRPLRLLGNMLRHPFDFLKTLWPVGWGRRTLVLLVMQTLDNAISFRARRRWFGRGIALTTRQDADKPNPTFIAAGNQAAEWLAGHTGGLAQSTLMEAAANVPSTAHLLGGVAIGRDAASGVVDANGRVFGYRKLIVCDGSIMPANPGVNPSLTITALAEHVMSCIPPADTDRLR